MHRLQETHKEVCPDEPNFSELYQVLGDRAKQDEIRKANPDVRHCDLLLMSPNACDGCPKNPERETRKLEEIDQEFLDDHMGLLNRAALLSDYAEMGLLYDPSQWTSTDMVIARIALTNRETQKLKDFAIIIGNEIGRAFNG